MPSNFEERSSGQPVHNPGQDLLLKFYDSEMKRVDFYENTRERTTAILLTLSGAVFLFVSSEKFKTPGLAILVGFAIIFIGLFGIAFSAKHYLRSRFHYSRARAYRDEVDRLFAAGRIKQLREYGEERFYKHFDKVWWSKRLDHVENYSLYWVFLPAMISAVGLLTVYVGVEMAWGSAQ